MKLIIIGPMASGKSVVGKKLSKRMGLNFFDTDGSTQRANIQLNSNDFLQ